MELLTENEQNWLVANHPGLTYLPLARMIAGTFQVHAKYQELENIADTYEVTIDLKHGNQFPTVYEINGKIERMATALNLPESDLHVNMDHTLCLIRPDKIMSHYHKGLNIKDFLKHLETHLYWVSYFYRYGKAPWQAEKHGW
jgi:hypothetical protein